MNDDKWLRAYLLRLTADPFLGPRPAIVDMVLEGVATRDWERVLSLASSFRRFDLFVLFAPRMSPAERREMLTSWWHSCDGCIWPWRKVALRYLREAGYIGDLPQPDTELLIYRGVSKSSHRLGLSWSTKIETARFFVRPFGRGRHRGGFVYSAVAPPWSFLAGFGDRNEAEYVVDPSLLTDVKRVEVVPPEL